MQEPDAATTEGFHKNYNESGEFYVTDVPQKHDKVEKFMFPLMD